MRGLRLFASSIFPKGVPAVKKFLALLLIALLLPASAFADVFSPTDAADALQTALDLCRTCAFSSEYGGAHPLSRWDGPIRIHLSGSPTRADREHLEEFVLQLCFRVPTMPNVTIVDDRSQANMFIWFGPLDEMSQHVTNYTEGNWGYFTYWYRSYRIVKAEIAVASDVTGQRERNHLVKEEIVGALGLTNDHDVFSDSIIYQPLTTTQELSEVDWLMLNMIYHPDVSPGWDWSMFQTVTDKRINNR